jgi:hypothetical protein
MAGPIETKVQASTAAAAVSGLALWSLGHWVFKAGVPDVVASWVYVLVPGVITFTAGYLAKHTDRPAATVTAPASLGPEIDAAMKRYAAGGLAAVRAEPAADPPEKTLIPPATAEPPT